MNLKFDDVSLFWDYLSTIWEKLDFDEKALIESVWLSYHNLSKEAFRELYQVDLSKAIADLPGWIMYRYETFPIFFSGPLQNTFLVSGLHNYYVPEWTYSIPTLSGVNHDPVVGYQGQLLTEGNDYEIIDFHRVQFLNYSGLQFDPSEEYHYINFWSPVRYMYNPILMDFYTLFTGFNNKEEIFSYKSFCGDTTKHHAEHYKNLCWAMWTKRRLPPTFKTIEDGIAISRGAPFAYTSGSVHFIDASTLSVGDYVYHLPTGSHLEEGETVSQFDILISGIYLYDAFEFRSELARFWSSINNSKTAVEILVTGLYYNNDYFLRMVSGLHPAGMEYIISGGE